MPSAKPESCSSCPLALKGRGWVPPTGPRTSPVLFLGEAPGSDEATVSEPFVGAAGALFQRALYKLDKDKKDYRIHNCISCQPPGNWLEGSPWEYAAISHCAGNLDSVLAEGHSVVVPLGNVALRRVLNLPQGKGFGVKDFHGTVTRDPSNRFWVVPTFHPSHIQRGAFNLFGTFLFDLAKAFEVAEHGWTQDVPELICDPSIDIWEQWVEGVLAQVRLNGPESVWLATDIETPDKARVGDEGELGVKDRSYTITRVNFAVGPDEGITVPFIGRYIEGIRRLIESGAALCLWNARYDIPRLRYHKCFPKGRVLDFMWAWHVLQSDTPRGLGFVAPFYSSYGAWKHLSGSDAVRYAALDGVQTWRVSTGIARDLQSKNMWEVFLRHIVELDETVLEPAEKVGLLADKDELEKMRVVLHGHSERFYQRIQELVPEELKGWHPKEGWRKEPKEGTIEALNETRRKNESPLLLAGFYRRDKSTLVKRCKTCQAEEITKSHRCENPDIEMVERTLPFWYCREEFNPASSQQILSYIAHYKHKAGKNRKTGKPSADKLTLETLVRTVKQPECQEFYQLCLSDREVTKIEGTYVVGNQKRLAEQEKLGITDGRLHGTFTHKPSTLRLSMVNPNLQNVVADRGGKESLAAGFKNCLVAAPGCKLIEADFSGIEAVLTGWFAGDPLYIRLAFLGVHAWLTSHVIGKPADLSWSDADLGAYFKDIKKHYDAEYQRCKRTVHGVSYGLTPYGMHERFPRNFPTLASAKKVVDLFFSIAPTIPKFQNTVREIAYKQNYLGGPGAHPFGYKHWFWDVFSYRKITDSAYVTRERTGQPCTRLNGQSYAIQFGEDAKRAVAFFPQSTAGGEIKEVALRLHDPAEENYIGDVFYGRTPTRALIHDSFLLEVPDEKVDSVIEKVVQEMTRPIVQLPCPEEWKIGSHLKINVAVKLGQSWGQMEEIDTGWVKEVGVAWDTTIRDFEDEEEEE